MQNYQMGYFINKKHLYLLISKATLKIGFVHTNDDGKTVNGC